MMSVQKLSIFRSRINELEEICILLEQEDWFNNNAPLLKKLSRKDPIRATQLVSRFISEFKQEKRTDEFSGFDYPKVKLAVENWIDKPIRENNTVVSILIGTHNLRRFSIPESIFSSSELVKITLLAGNPNEIRVALEEGLEHYETLDTHPNSDLPLIVIDAETKNIVITAIFGKNKGNAKKIDYLAIEDYFLDQIPEIFAHFIHDWNLKIDLIATTNGGCGAIGTVTVLEELKKFMGEMTLVLFIERPSSELVMGASLNTTMQLGSLLSSTRYRHLRIMRINQDAFDRNAMGEKMVSRMIEAFLTGIKFSHSDYTAGADLSDFVNTQEGI